MHKLDPGFCAHYLALQFAIPDVSAPDEIVVVIARATGSRMHPRIGNRYEDMEERPARRRAAAIDSDRHARLGGFRGQSIFPAYVFRAYDSIGTMEIR